MKFNPTWIIAIVAIYGVYQANEQGIKSLNYTTEFWLYFSQILAIGILNFIFKNKITSQITSVNPDVKAKLDTFKIPSTLHPDLVRYSSKRIMSIQNAVQALIITWGLLYIFMSSVELYDLHNEEWSTPYIPSLIRIFNYIDSFLLMCLGVLFVAQKDIFTFKKLVQHRPYLFSIFLLLIGFEGAYLASLNSLLSNTLTIASGLWASLCFLSFFSRLDSIFLSVDRSLIILLFLYGIFQIYYPMEMINFDSVRSESIIGSTVKWVGTPVKILGKIFIGLILCASFYREDQIVYFSSIFNYKKA